MVCRASSFFSEAHSHADGQTYGQRAFGIKDRGTQGDLIAGGLYIRTDVNTCDKLSNIAATLPVHPGNFVVTGI